MTRRDPWFAAIPAIDATVDCDGTAHRVSWRRGKLVLHDHRLGDEAVFVALGGAPPPCFVVLQSWRDRRGWAAATRPHPPGFIRRVTPPPLPAALAIVRRLGVVRAWERRWRSLDGPEEAEDLYRMLRKQALPRVARALDADRARLGGGPAQFVEVRLGRPHGRPRVEGRIDRARSSIVVTLLPEWLYAVGTTPASERGFEISAGKYVVWKESATGIWEPVIAQRS